MTNSSRTAAAMLVFILTLPAYGAKLIKECHSYSAPVQWAYCSFKTEGSANPDILYHLHGKGLKEDAWNDEKPGDLPYYPALVREQWSEAGFEAPTVVTVDFVLPGIPAWLLIEKNERPASGLLEVMTGTVMPFIEKALGGLRGKRMLVGESMGGLNAAELTMKAGGLFERVAVLCPALTILSPFATAQEIAAFQRRTKARPDLIATLLTLSRVFIPTPAVWEKTSPVLLAESAAAFGPKLYVSCGSHDHWGFYEGAEAFARAAKAKKDGTEWRPLYGDHCAIDIKSVARFLSE